MTTPYTDFPDLTPGDDIELIRQDLKAAQAMVMRELGSEATDESFAHYPPGLALARLEGLLLQLRDQASNILEPGQTASAEDLLGEYQRLYGIEDAATAILVGRLRDMPEEEMAQLWSALAAALDARGPLRERMNKKEDL